MQSHLTPARDYAKGIGDAVADRTINRKITRDVTPYKKTIELPRRDDMSLDNEVAEWCKSNGFVTDGYFVPYGDDLVVKVELNVVAEVRVETWADVARRVAEGSASLVLNSRGVAHAEAEFESMHHHLRQASVLMSGRHLQHGDIDQATRPMEVFTNCVDGSTRILTMEYGPVEIEKIAGETVTVIAGDGQPRPAMIHKHGEQELYEVTFRAVKGGGGKFRHSVKATANHRWVLRGGDVTEALKVGDVVAPINGDIGFDPIAVTHGVVFGDGSAHKGRRDHATSVSAGRTYASIRVCKQDKVRDEICEYLDAGGYKFTTPVSASGDRVYYVGKFEHVKDVPFCNDPEYVAGFIYGWWLADGSKGVDGSLEISTANEIAANWLLGHSGYGGFTVSMHRVMERKEGDGSFANGKALHVIRLRRNSEWKVESIEFVGKAPVYCPEEPVTSSFVLANGLLTGNCSTSANSFLTFYLLLNGSGVGRSYDDSMIIAKMSNLPIVVPVIDGSHPDAASGEVVAIDMRHARHMYSGRTVHAFEVPDSREGWAKALERMETMAFLGKFRDDVLLLDFSKVRHRGSPIKGMQGRPASGPGPLMTAIENVAKLRDSGMAPWRAAMFADHYLAECVLVGGARRAARMATKYWKDESILDFVAVKRGGFLWTSNNSVAVDAEFWRHVENAQHGTHSHDPYVDEMQTRAFAVFKAVCEAAYHDKTGEPGLINVDKLTWSDEGVEALADGRYAESERYKLDDDTLELTKGLVAAWLASDHKVITNPCGEIVLSAVGGYCVIADVVPFHAGTPIPGRIYPQDMRSAQTRWDDDAEDAFRTATRALIRTNTMNSLYAKEVARTNRIGVGITGMHEYAFARFGYGWKDIVDEVRSKDFWLMLARFKRAVQEEAATYSTLLGLNIPHTDTTIKPAGTTSKLFGLSEGAHLPTMREYIRWVQFRNDDPLIVEYQAKGYPVRYLKVYKGTTIVGFPTRPTICDMGMGDKLVTAAEATPDEQYRYLALLEKYWITGVAEDGVTPLRETGNQVSYTLKYKPDLVSYEEFDRTLLEGQSKIRCCSVMPQEDKSAYEYLPEQSVSKHEYEQIAEAIAAAGTVAMKEDIGFEHVDCGTGGCPVSFDEN